MTSICLLKGLSVCSILSGVDTEVPSKDQDCVLSLGVPFMRGD